MLRMAAWGLVAALAAGGVALASTDGVNNNKSWRNVESQKARTAPVGKVYREGDELANPPPVAAAAGAGARSGEQIYNTACMACHATGAAGAPKRGDKAAWAARLKKGDAGLMNSLKNGFNAMPAKGMCMDCSDDEFKSVLGYMVESVK